MVGSAEPVVCEFFRLIPGAPEPRRADRSADGTLPVNAYRYCEAIASASSFGWYLYPPLSFSLWWDGTEIAWTYEGADGWYPLRGAQYPNFRETFQKVAPDGLRELAPHSSFRGCCRELCRSGAGIWRARRHDGRCYRGARSIFQKHKATRISRVSSRLIRGSARSLQMCA
jgi:hypothetical protein